MAGPDPAVAAVRYAVRQALRALPSLPSQPSQPSNSPESGNLPTHLAAAMSDAPRVLVACSGGVDSLALAAGVAFEAPRAGLRAGAVVVDHGLQQGSSAVARRAAYQCRDLGLDPVVVEQVTVAAVGEGPEAAARQARYAALDAVANRLGAVAVLLAHTRDDQAEQVLLGLARGSGARSLAGMPSARGRYLRPLLGVSRAETEATCTAYRLEPWRDPHNADPRFARVRARAALRDLEVDLGPGLTEALARSAELLRDDADLLDSLAAEALSRLDPESVAVGDLADVPPALRRRVWLLLAAQAGCDALTKTHVAALDALVMAWRGQGPVNLPGRVSAQRQDGRIVWSQGDHISR